MSENKLPSNKGPKSSCKYNTGVICSVPEQGGACGKCGWKPNEARKRLEKKA